MAVQMPCPGSCSVIAADDGQRTGIAVRDLLRPIAVLGTRRAGLASQAAQGAGRVGLQAVAAAGLKVETAIGQSPGWAGSHAGLGCAGRAGAAILQWWAGDKVGVGQGYRPVGVPTAPFLVHADH